MHFLKTLFWVLVAVLTVIFSLRNWVPVSINLWSGFTAAVKLPILILAGILIGFLPTYTVHRTKMWRMKRRLDTIERNTLTAPPPPATDQAAEASPIGAYE